MIMVSWMAKHHGGFIPLISGSHLHTESSLAVEPMKSFGLVVPQVPPSNG
jgi:hypothetical protein